MFRLAIPRISFEEVLSGCISAMRDASGLRQRLVESRVELKGVEPPYVDSARKGELCELPFLPRGASKSYMVCRELTKGDLMSLYNDHFVSKEKPNRRFYEDLINTAEDKCPFCGGIGNPTNLDHFLPKSRCPQYSVLPTNLVPSCRDCNLSFKSDSVPLCSSEQVLQPYLDSDAYFKTQWVFGKYESGSLDEVGEISFYVAVPPSWGEASKARVQRHFQDFSLERRYGDRASELLPIVLDQLRGMEKLDLTAETVALTLLDPPINSAPFVNHWRRVAYQAIKSWYFALCGGGRRNVSGP